VNRYTYLIISRSVLLRIKIISDKSCREARTKCSIFFSKFVPFMNRAGHRWQNCACSLHAGYLMLKCTHRTCNTHCFTTATMVTRTRLNITLYLHDLSCKELRLLIPSFRNVTEFVTLRQTYHRQNPFDLIYTSIVALLMALQGQSTWNSLSFYFVKRTSSSVGGSMLKILIYWIKL
jgi:hypothetical protein